MKEPIAIHRVAPFADRPDREDADEEHDGRAVGGPAQDAEVPDADPPEQREGEHPAGGDQALPHRELAARR